MEESLRIFLIVHIEAVIFHRFPFFALDPLWYPAFRYSLPKPSAGREPTVVRIAVSLFRSTARKGKVSPLPGSLRPTGIRERTEEGARAETSSPRYRAQGAGRPHRHLNIRIELPCPPGLTLRSVRPVSAARLIPITSTLAWEARRQCFRPALRSLDRARGPENGTRPTSEGRTGCLSDNTAQ